MKNDKGRLFAEMVISYKTTANKNCAQKMDDRGEVGEEIEDKNT